MNADDDAWIDALRGHPRLGTDSVTLAQANELRRALAERQGIADAVPPPLDDDPGLQRLMFRLRRERLLDAPERVESARSSAAARWRLPAAAAIVVLGVAALLVEREREATTVLARREREVAETLAAAPRASRERELAVVLDERVRELAAAQVRLAEAKFQLATAEDESAREAAREHFQGAFRYQGQREREAVAVLNMRMRELAEAADKRHSAQVEWEREVAVVPGKLSPPGPVQLLTVTDARGDAERIATELRAAGATVSTSDVGDGVVEVVATVPPAAAASAAQILAERGLRPLGVDGALRFKVRPRAER